MTSNKGYQTHGIRQLCKAMLGSLPENVSPLAPVAPVKFRTFPGINFAGAGKLSVFSIEGVFFDVFPT